MKTLLICFTLLISISVNAQNVNDWQIGINAYPFHFKSFRSGIDESVLSAPFRTKQDFPNGFASALSLEKSINEQWSIETGIEFSWQKENFSENYDYSDQYPIVIEYKFTYTNFPTKVNFYKPLNNNFWLSVNQGVQISFLSRYTIYTDDIHYTVSIDNNNYYFLDKDDNFTSEFKRDWYYKKKTFGLVGGVGIKKVFHDKWSYSAQLKYEYDLTNAKNYDLLVRWGDVSRHFRIGLDLGIQYHFNLKSNHQSKCPE